MTANFVICNEPIGLEYPGQLCGLQSGHEGPHCFAQVPVDTTVDFDSVAAFTPDMPESETSVLYGGCTHTPPHSIYEIRECETQGNSHES